jgi:pimeloyl-ACP methyl ester carboxylesterase
MRNIKRHLVSTRFGQIHCRDTGAPGGGTAPTFVFMHINQQSSALYLELMSELAPAARAVAIDYPSCGMSDHIDFQPSIADYAECVIAVMDGLGIGRACAVGEATGAAVAIELGVAHPTRIDTVALLNCPFYRNRKQAHDVHAPLKADLRPSDTSGFPMTRTLDFMHEKDPSHAPLHPDQFWMDRINIAQIEAGRDRWQALDALNAYDIGDGMQRLKCPTLLLMGEHFHYTSMIDEYRRRLQGLVAAEIVAGARFCMGWEKAAHIGPRLLRFLEERQPAAA